MAGLSWRTVTCVGVGKRCQACAHVTGAIWRGEDHKKARTAEERPYGIVAQAKFEYLRNKSFVNDFRGAKSKERHRPRRVGSQKASRLC